jgi:hypothetical protein
VVPEISRTAADGLGADSSPAWGPFRECAGPESRLTCGVEAVISSLADDRHAASRSSLAAKCSVSHISIRRHGSALCISDGRSAPSGSSWWERIRSTRSEKRARSDWTQDGRAYNRAFLSCDRACRVRSSKRPKFSLAQKTAPDGPFPSMSVSRFARESATPGPFHDVIALYAQATLLQIMQGTACNALHGVKQRCCRWLLQTQDRVDSREFLLQQEFLAIMLGVQRPTVTLVIGALQDDGLISTRYGRIRVLKRKKLEQTACECYEVIRAHFQRLGL